MCDAIEKATQGVNGKNFSHIGLVYIKRDTFLVIEAIGTKVQLTPLNKFMERSVDVNGNYKIVIGRWLSLLEHSPSL